MEKDEQIESSAEADEFRRHVQHLIDLKEYREAFRTCNQYINEGRCTKTANELLVTVGTLLQQETKKKRMWEGFWIILILAIVIAVNLVIVFSA